MFGNPVVQFVLFGKRFDQIVSVPLPLLAPLFFVSLFVVM